MDKIAISLNSAAPLVGMDRKSLMAWVRSGKCPFGAFIKSDDSKYGHYYINYKRLQVYLSGDDMRTVCPYAQQAELYSE